MLSFRNKKQWYEELFENYSEKYDKENFTQGTIRECDFIELEINYDRSLKILDVGCGTGRHALELTRRGYDVTGIDLSESQLKRAREKAQQDNLIINFYKYDARSLPFYNDFDIAIMLCEGGFSLMETDEMNYEILKNVSKALRKSGKLIFTTLNALYPLFNIIEEYQSPSTENKSIIKKKNSFNLMTLRDHNIIEIEDDSGNKKTLKCNEKYYMPSEINWLLKSLDYKKIDIFGAKLGAFSRNDLLTSKDLEMLVVSEK